MNFVSSFFKPKEATAIDTKTRQSSRAILPAEETKHFNDETHLSDKKKPMGRVNVPRAMGADAFFRGFNNNNSWSTSTYSSDEEFCDASDIVRKSFDETGFIEGKWRGNHLIELDSCQFIHPFSNKTAFIRKQNAGHIFTFDEDIFVARVRFEKVDHLNFSKRALYLKEDLLKKIQFTKIIEDETLYERDKAFQTFKNLLQERSNNTGKNLNCAEDVFQVFNGLESFERLQENPSILNELFKNKFISSELKESIQKLLACEIALGVRREEFLELPQIYTMNLLSELKQICKRASENHRKILVERYLESIPQITPSVMPNHFSKFDDILLFLISYKDVELFADLVVMMKEKPFLDFAIEVWNTFFKRVEKIGKEMYRNFSIKQTAPLTSSIYFYLCKSFKEVVLEISEKTNISLQDLLKKNETDKWVLINTITWPADSPLNRSLEQQYHFIFLTMKHFEPGHYSYKNKFAYKYHLFKDSKMMSKQFSEHLNDKDEMNSPSDERLVWIYILDNAIKNLVSKREFELFEPLITGFSNFARDSKEDQFESFRIAALNEIKFVAQTSPYLSKGASENILKKEIESIRKACADKNSDDFKDLVDVFNEFWLKRQFILEEVPKKFPCEDFEQNMEKLCQSLLDIVSVALDKDTKSQETIKFFRSFNEFLEDLNNLDFTWFIKKDDIENCIPKHYLENVYDHLELVNEDKKSYKILNPQNFINMAEKVPKHYIIDIVQDLLNTLLNSLNKTQWSNEDNLNATSELLTAVKKSFLYLKEQPYYVSFDLFKKESTEPFASVVENSNSYEDLQKRISIVGESFWYLRRQDEINIEKALELYQKENSIEDASLEELKNCYDKYLEKFSFYIQETLNLSFEEKIKFIIEKVKNSEYKQCKIEDWDLKLKRETMPELLAGLAAVWSIQESKDISSTGKVLKPHCIQILCILRLLSVDKDSNGIDKHLAQVLTGQGKSLILGLLSALLALMGYKVRMVCYSEYLASRDKNDFEILFKRFGLHKKITYGTFNDMANEIIAPELNGMKMGLRKLVVDRILSRGIEQVGLMKQNDVSRSILLLDEVDVFFSDDFYGNTYNPCQRIGFQGLAAIQEKIWEMANKGYEKGTIITEIKEFVTEEIKERVESFLEFDKFLRKPLKYKILRMTNKILVEKEYTNQSLYEEQLEFMIETAVNVTSGVSAYTDAFQINDNGIIGNRESDGLYCTSTIRNYYNTFNYFRLKKSDFDARSFENYGYLLIYCGNISYAKLPENYPLILGVSGTLTTLHEHERKAVKYFYKINESSTMPSFFGDSHIKFDYVNDFIALNTEEEWLIKIFRRANSQINAGRSVIVFFDTDVEIEKFDKKFLGKFDRLRILTPNTEKLTRERYINEAGISKTITLATRGMGRGVDYKSSVAVEKNGGVHVMQTFFSLDIKEETQIKGRTARKDCKGSYELVLCKEHLIKAKLLQNTEAVVTYESLSKCSELIILEKGLKNEEKILESENEHKKTMEYLESFFSKESSSEKSDSETNSSSEDYE